MCQLTKYNVALAILQLEMIRLVVLFTNEDWVIILDSVLIHGKFGYPVIFLLFFFTEMVRQMLSNSKLPIFAQAVGSH